MDIKIGAKIKELRINNNILQKELAIDLNLSQQTISLYEADKRQPSYSNLVSIADYFNVSVDFLLGRKERKDEIEKERNEIKIEKIKKEIHNILKEKGAEATLDINEFLKKMKSCT